MKYVVSIILAFAVGVFVGRPSQIVVQAENFKECTIIQAHYSNEDTPKVVQTSKETPKVAVTETVKEVIKTEDKKDEPQKDTDAREHKEVESNEPQSTPEQQTQIQHEQIDDMVDKLIKMFAVYDFDEDQKITFTEVDLQHLDYTRNKVNEANLIIKEEGRMNIGKFVYYLKIGTRDQ